MKRWILAVILAVSMALAAGQLAGILGTTAAAETSIEAARVDGALPVTDVSAAAWDRATPVDVAISAQNAVAPIRTTPSVPTLQVRVLANKTHAAFLITWNDATKNNRTTRDQEFRDAVAILYGPADATPFLCMGGPGKALHVTQWKADWQADVEEGFRDLEHAYPNFWVDYYPGAIGGPPYHTPTSFLNDSRLYLPGWKVGNPFSDPLKVTSVEEGVAEGFGTLATQESQDAVGFGTYTGSSWKVIISRPLAGTDGDDVPITDGTILAFAVWDGASGDVGGRKSVSSWTSLKMPGESGILFWVATGLFLFLVMAVLVVLATGRLRRKAEPERAPDKKTVEVTKRDAPGK